MLINPSVQMRLKVYVCEWMFYNLYLNTKNNEKFGTNLH